MDECALYDDCRAGPHGLECFVDPRLVDASRTVYLDNGETRLPQVIDVLAFVRKSPLGEDLQQRIVWFRLLELAA